MPKSDQIIHSFCIYEIKRHTIKPYVFWWTNFYENYSDFLQVYPEIQLAIAEDELIICSTVIDADNYSLLTTRRFVTKEKGIEGTAHMAGAKGYNLPINHVLEKYDYVLGTVELRDGNTFRFFIEAGKPAMVMTYGIRTLIWCQALTDSQMINLMRLWDKRSKS
ncbi:hypothetical protein ACFFGT_31200 [Mucilaginibacter angelicae]|uniref:SRPBCC family protein n=1 Tax=Mucilaginibacter angelicae TaxID=869718 RepID=A0ABV6LGY1_9SPHI